jgi:integrase
MSLKSRYENGKRKLLADEFICVENQQLFSQFLEFEEYRLKRRNDLQFLDNGCYGTLVGYLTRLRNVNAWFNNKPWKDLTREEIKRVHDDLEDGRIVNQRGQRFKDRGGYYRKIFRAKPFELAGKSDIAREVIEYASARTEEVRFLEEANFKKMVAVLSKPRHFLLFWLAWDIGENINTLLRLQKRDFARQTDPHSGVVEYLVNLPRQKLKRSRKERGEITIHDETVLYLDMVLRDLDDDNYVFPFGYEQSKRILKSAQQKSGAVCSPNSDHVMWKDFRSGMACHLLKLGVSVDEINARLGHAPGSQEIKKYLNFLAIDRRVTKDKLIQKASKENKQELHEYKQREKLWVERFRRQEERIAITQAELHSLKQSVKTLIAQTAQAA